MLQEKSEDKGNPRKIIQTGWLITIIVALVLAVMHTGQARNAEAANDLTGLWMDDMGGSAVYRVVQKGNKLYWVFDNTAEGGCLNVYSGSISGKIITGDWVEVPGSACQGGGEMVLRIDSNDRFVKIKNPPCPNCYGGAAGEVVWTRQTTTTATDNGAPPGPSSPAVPAPSTVRPVRPSTTPIESGPKAPAVPTPASSRAPTIDWNTSPHEHAPALDGEHNVGNRFAFNCPPDGHPGRLFGTGIHDSLSSICTAAAHAGVISLEDGGSVTIEMKDGQPSYTGSTQNGIKSLSWPSPTEWSFVVVKP